MLFPLDFQDITFHWYSFNFTDCSFLSPVFVAGIYCESLNRPGMSPCLCSLSLSLWLNYAHFRNNLIYACGSTCYLALITTKSIILVWLCLLTLDSTVYFIYQLGGKTGLSYLIYPKLHF